MEIRCSFTHCVAGYVGARPCMQKYDRIQHIGQGTYGHVYRGYIKGTKEAVAIKKFKESDDLDTQVRPCQECRF